MKSLSSEKLDKIRENKEWDSSMLQYKYDVEEKQECTSGDLVNLLPMSAITGSLTDFCASMENYNCEKIVTPVSGIDCAITVSGDSMSPKYNNGDIVFIQKINERAFIPWGEVLVISTCNGTVIKRVKPSSRDRYIICESINSDYPNFEVSLDDVYGVYKILIKLSRV